MTDAQVQIIGTLVTLVALLVGYWKLRQRADLDAKNMRDKIAKTAKQRVGVELQLHYRMMELEKIGKCIELASKVRSEFWLAAHMTPEQKRTGANTQLVFNLIAELDGVKFMMPKELLAAMQPYRDTIMDYSKVVRQGQDPKDVNAEAIEKLQEWADVVLKWVHENRADIDRLFKQVTEDE
jgi:hypothetical protein